MSDYSPYFDNSQYQSNLYREFSISRVTSTQPYSDYVYSAKTGVYLNYLYQPHTVHFLDGDLLVNPTANESAVYRLYDAAFSRPADKNGLDYWTSQVNAGVSYSSIASSFVQSNEFNVTYGSLTNSDFVQKVYTNVLHRAPDSQGFNYYNNLLNSGTTRAQVLLSLSESPEHQNTVVQYGEKGGLFVVDNSAAPVEFLYQAVLGRIPDQAGLKFYINAIDNNTLTLNNVAGQIAQSFEFQNKYGNLGDTGFVNQLYLNTLGRQGEASGTNYWVDQLAHGASKADIALAFSQTPEFEHKYSKTLVDHGLLFF